MTGGDERALGFLGRPFSAPYGVSYFPVGELLAHTR